MVEVLIKFSLDKSHPLPTYLKFALPNKCLYEGSFSTELALFVPDMLSEIKFDLEISSTAFSFSFYLLPLLTRPNFTLFFQQDPTSLLFILTEKAEDSKFKIEISSKHELDSTTFNKVNRIGRVEECLGVDLNEKRFGTKKYLENLLIGLNGKLIQQEAKQVIESGTKNISEISQQSFEQNIDFEDLNNFTEKSQESELNTKTQFDQQRKIIDLEATIKQQESMIDQFKAQNIKLAEELLEEKNKNHSLSLSNEKFMNKIANLKNSLINYQTTEKIVKDLQDQISILKNAAVEQETSKNLIKKSLETCLSEFQSSIHSFEAHQLSSDQLHTTLTETINTKNLEIKDLQDQNSLLSTENQKLLAELQCHKAESQITKKFSKLLENSSSTEFPNLNSAPETTNILEVFNNNSKIDEQAEQMHNLIEKLKITQKKLEEAEENNKNQEDIIKIMVVKTQIEETNETIEKKPQFMDEFLKILEQLREINEVGIDFEMKFYATAMGYLKRINKLSELNLNLHRLFEKFFKLMYDKDCQIYMLRHIARDAQMQRNIYIPVKSDPIDVCMGEFINNRKVPLSIPLLREDQGVYNFYTRTIKVKVENNRVIVRLGGGFQGIEEFLNQNTQVELDKLEERRKFGCAEAVKKLIDSDFQIMGLPAAIDHLTPPIASNETSFSSNANNSILLESLSQVQQKKRTSLLVKDGSKGQITKKKTFN